MGRPCENESGIQTGICCGIDNCENTPTSCVIAHKRREMEKNMAYGVFVHRPTEIRACQFIDCPKCREELVSMGLKKVMIRYIGDELMLSLPGKQPAYLKQGDYAALIDGKIRAVAKDRFEQLYMKKEESNV